MPIFNAVFEETFLPKSNWVDFAFWHVLFFKIWLSLGLFTIGLRIPFISLDAGVRLACQREGTLFHRSVGHDTWQSLTPAKYWNLFKLLFLHLCYGGNNLHHRVIARIKQNNWLESSSRHAPCLGAWSHGSFLWHSCCTPASLPVLKT